MVSAKLHGMKLHGMKPNVTYLTMTSPTVNKRAVPTWYPAAQLSLLSHPPGGGGGAGGVPEGVHEAIAGRKTSSWKMRLLQSKGQEGGNGSGMR